MTGAEIKVTLAQLNITKIHHQLMKLITFKQFCFNKGSLKGCPLVQSTCPHKDRRCLNVADLSDAI